MSRQLSGTARFRTAGFVPLVLLLGGGAPPDPTTGLYAGQGWTVQSRSAGGILDTFTLRLTRQVESPSSGSVTWDAALEEPEAVRDVSQVRLTLEPREAGQVRLTASVLSFDGRSQPDLRICVVTGSWKTGLVVSWSGVYALGLSGSRVLNSLLKGGTPDGLGTCTLTQQGEEKRLSSPDLRS